MNKQNLKIGSIVEYKNFDNDFKLAILTQNVAGQYYDAITFSGRSVHLGIGHNVPAQLAGHISQVIAENLNEYLSEQSISREE